MARGQTAYAVIRALGTIAIEPQSVPSLAETIEIGPRSARLMMVALAKIRLVERVPDDPHRKRYRIAPRGRELGGYLLLAEQTVEPYVRPQPTGAKKRSQTISTLILGLQAIAEAPQATRQVAELLGTSERAARTFIASLRRLRVIEVVPGDGVLQRYRVAARGRELGALLLLAKHDVRPYRFSDHGVRHRRPM